VSTTAVPAFVIETGRTYIVETPTAALERSRALEEFEFDLSLDVGVVPVRVTPDWPGDELGALPDVLALRRRGEAEPWNAMVIDRDSLEAVGQIGCTALPDAHGRVEVRYATLPEWRDRGYATEAGGAFVDWLLRQRGVEGVVAECQVTNAPSVRVLEKTGFEILEEREDEAGRLLRWIKRRPEADDASP
jgi:[ribosomal protein S5]-alanine N-acetyltransferase